MNKADWKPTASLQLLKQRANLNTAIREYFASTGALEVETQMLGKSPVSDPNIASLEVQLSGTSDPHFLHTSPEYQMKRLLAAGTPDIFQICHVFRDAESGHRHQPEFTMLEWYRHSFSLDEIIRETLRIIDLAKPQTTKLQKIRYQDAMLQAVGIDVLDPDESLIDEVLDSDQFQGTLSLSEKLDWLMAHHVVSRFCADTLTVIYDYPANQAALARLNPDDPRCADRFEIFAGDLELANGFVELTDADEQRRRFEADMASREARGETPRPPDEDLLAALASGLPDCAGVALGLDRLLMHASGLRSISDGQAFAVHRTD